jgi:uncharacterized protein YkwD
MRFLLMVFLMLPENAHSQNYAEMSSQGFFSLELLDAPVNPINPNVDLLNAALFHFANQSRRKSGRAELLNDSNLQKAATLHASQMIGRNFFDHHNRFSRKWADLDDRLNWAGFSWQAAAENIHETYIGINDKTYRELAQEIIRAFMDSPPHKANLLSGKMKCLGVAAVFSEKPVRDGKYSCKITQVFASPF